MFERLEDRRVLASLDFGFALAAGSTWDNYGQAIVTDADGSVYVSGSFQGAVDFDPGGSELERILFGLVDVSPRTDTAGLAEPDRVHVDDCVRAVIDRKFARMGIEGTEAWTKSVGRTTDRPSLSLERNQRFARLGDRGDALEETLSLLAEQTPRQLPDDAQF